MGRIKIKVTKTYRKSQTTTDSQGRKHCKTCGAFISGRGKKKKQVIPIKFEFTKQEIEEIKSKIYLTDLQEKILDLKLKGDLTEYGMAIKLGVSESTITYQWKKVKQKIFKVI